MSSNYNLASLDIDNKLLDKLGSAYGSFEGSTFNYPARNLDGDKDWLIQTYFKISVLEKVNPRMILEVGTHRGDFCYLAKLVCPKVKIFTFGWDEESRDCIEILNDYFKEDFIHFCHGDSTVTMPTFFNKTSNSKSFNRVLQDIDLAWIDGGHHFDVAFSDIMIACKTGIPYIMVDDCNVDRVKGPEAAIRKNLELYNYEIVKKSADLREVWLLKKED